MWLIDETDDKFINDHNKGKENLINLKRLL